MEKTNTQFRNDHLQTKASPFLWFPSVQISLHMYWQALAFQNKAIAARAVHVQDYFSWSFSLVGPRGTFTFPVLWKPIHHHAQPTSSLPASLVNWLYRIQMLFFPLLSVLPRLLFCSQNVSSWHYLCTTMQSYHHGYTQYRQILKKLPDSYMGSTQPMLCPMCSYA